MPKIKAKKLHIPQVPTIFLIFLLILCAEYLFLKNIPDSAISSLSSSIHGLYNLLFGEKEIDLAKKTTPISPKMPPHKEPNYESLIQAFCSLSAKIEGLESAVYDLKKDKEKFAKENLLNTKKLRLQIKRLTFLIGELEKSQAEFMLKLKVSEKEKDIAKLQAQKAFQEKQALKRKIENLKSLIKSLKEDLNKIKDKKPIVITSREKIPDEERKRLARKIREMERRLAALEAENKEAKKREKILIAARDEALLRIQALEKERKELLHYILMLKEEKEKIKEEIIPPVKSDEERAKELIEDAKLLVKEAVKFGAERYEPILLKKVQGQIEESERLLEEEKIIKCLVEAAEAHRNATELNKISKEKYDRYTSSGFVKFIRILLFWKED